MKGHGPALTFLDSPLNDKENASPYVLVIVIAELVQSLIDILVQLEIPASAKAEQLDHLAQKVRIGGFICLLQLIKAELAELSLVKSLQYVSCGDGERIILIDSFRFLLFFGSNVEQRCDDLE